MITQAPTYRWTREGWHKLGEAGIFNESDRVELLNGEIVIMSPVGYRHHKAVSRLSRFFSKREHDRFVTTPQSPIVLDDHSEPQPDVILATTAWDERSTDNPSPEETFLVVEVADSTLPFDRGEKLRAYAARGIREFWIVDLQHDILETYREPFAVSGGDAGYAMKTASSRGESVAPAAFPDLLVPVSEIIP